MPLDRTESPPDSRPLHRGREADDHVWSDPIYRQFVIKIHSRCDLACDYCYVYTKADQRWRHRPTVMSPEVMAQTARRIGEYARAHRLAELDVVLHGGEPLLAGVERIGRLSAALSSSIPGGTRLALSLQTNAMRLESALPALNELGIGIGVSIDGTAEGQDRHRRTHSGRSSHGQVHRALNRLRSPQYRHLFRGLLCTIDLESDPAETYDALLGYAPPQIDFLLPDGNWVSPPPGRDPGMSSPYGDWLITVFDRWYGSPRPGPGIRFFEEIIQLLLGGRSRLEGLGGAPAAVLVIQTDGEIERSDALSSAYEGAAGTGLNVAGSAFEGVLTAARTRHILPSPGPPLACLGCELQPVCGGGLEAHRYNGAGFEDTSVYCADLYRLISHIRLRLSEDVSALRTRP